MREIRGRDRLHFLLALVLYTVTPFTLCLLPFLVPRVMIWLEVLTIIGEIKFSLRILFLLDCLMILIPVKECFNHLQFDKS